MEIQTKNTVKKTRFHRPARIAGMVILGILGAVTLAFLFGYFVMLLWNWLIVDTFAWLSSPITYWQAFGIVLLAKLLFGSFGGHKHDHSEKYHKHSKKYREMKCKKDYSKEYYRKWRYYDDFWESEGEDAFNEYVEKRNHEDINHEVAE